MTSSKLNKTTQVVMYKKEKAKRGMACAWGINKI